MRNRFVTLLALLCLLMSLALPVHAAEGAYIHETTGALLTETEAADLDSRCADAAAAYDCGIYAVVLPDYSEYGYDPLSAAEQMYMDMGFGVGENRNGILLMLSMSERDYALVCYGDIANSVFTDRTQARITEDFLDDFGVNHWQGGFEDYVDGCVEALAGFDGTVGEAYDGYYEDGVYYPETAGSRLAYVLSGYGWAIMLISLVIALVVCLVMKGQMKTAKIATRAGEYIPKGGVDLRVRQDTFTHTTRQVIHHERDTNSGGGGGGTSVRSSGFSGRSGKF